MIEALLYKSEAEEQQQQTCLRVTFARDEKYTIIEMKILNKIKRSHKIT